MKPEELRDKSVDELEAILDDTLSELFVMRNEAQTSKDSKNSNKIRLARKDVARLKTILKEKELVTN